MKTLCVHLTLSVFALFSSSVSAQEWISWKGQPTPQAQPTKQESIAAQPAQTAQQSASQPAPVEQISTSEPAAAISDVSISSINKAECDAEVATAYPAYVWAPGLSQKRKELFAACMAKRSAQSAPVAPVAQAPASQAATTTSNASSTSISKAECDAEVATTYPAYVWAPGLGQKRKELFAACMSKRSQPSTQASSSSSITKAECDARVAKAYPAFIWAPGLNQKRKELFTACMANSAGN